MNTAQPKNSWLGLLVTLAVFLVILAALVVGTINLSGDTGQEGQRATQQAVERAAILCYATEGFYPPSLQYIEENYGVQIDYGRYTIQYEAFASNVMPAIRVSSW